MHPQKKKASGECRVKIQIPAPQKTFAFPTNPVDLLEFMSTLNSKIETKDKNNEEVLKQTADWISGLPNVDFQLLWRCSELGHFMSEHPNLKGLSFELVCFFSSWPVIRIRREKNPEQMELVFVESDSFFRIARQLFVPDPQKKLKNSKRLSKTTGTASD